MKRCIISTLIMAMGIVGAQAQSDFDLILDKEGKIIALPKNKTYELHIPKLSYKTFTPKGSRDVDIKLREFKADISTPTLQEHPMDMHISSEAYQPFFNIYTQMIRDVSPMALDFNETYLTRMNDHIDILANGMQYTWPGAGGMTIFNTGVRWHNERWNVYGGGFGGRFFTPFNSSPGITTGVHVQAEYRATDWLRLKGWGQYVYYADEYNNPHMARNPFFYHSRVGGAFEFKVTDNFWIGAGFNYEHNPATRKMEPQFMVYPAFNTRHFRIGM